MGSTHAYISYTSHVTDIHKVITPAQKETSVHSRMWAVCGCSRRRRRDQFQTLVLRMYCRPWPVRGEISVDIWKAEP